MADSIDNVYPYRRPALWHRMLVLAAAVVPLVLTVFGVVSLWGAHVGWAHLFLLLLFWGLTVMGISLGYHRMLAHGAFRARAPLRAFLLACAGMSLQGGAATWAATHRRHHARSDKEGDPHSPVEGLLHAHMGWLLKGRLVEKGPAHAQLMQDPIVRFFEKTQAAWMAMSFIVPGLVGMFLPGMSFWSGMLWGGAVRVFLVHHITWSVNSVCHVLGTRPYRSPDIARNNGLFAWLGFGEGWHNNHHAFPQSAWLGHRWWQFDPGKYLLVVFRWVRLVHHVHIPTRAERLARAAG